MDKVQSGLSGPFYLLMGDLRTNQLSGKAENDGDELTYKVTTKKSILVSHSESKVDMTTTNKQKKGRTKIKE